VKSGRLRLALTDTPGPARVLSLPKQKTWPIALFLGGLCVVFAIPAAGDMGRLFGPENRGDMAFVSTAFSVFGAAIWSAVAMALFAAAMVLFFYRDEIRSSAEKLQYVSRAGPLRLVMEYDLARIGKLRKGSAAERGLENLCFDYGGVTVPFARALPRASLDDAMRFVREALDSRAGGPAAPITEPATEPARTELPAEPAPVQSRYAGLSVALLIVANFVPVIGVLRFDWDLGQLMVLFWAENAVVGFFGLAKLVVVQRWLALISVPFFIMHFGMFMAVHFMFVYELFVAGRKGPPLDSQVMLALLAPLWSAILAIFISHGVSFFGNFLARREYIARKSNDQMAEPYRRVMVLHVTLIFGGFAVMSLGQPIFALLLLVALKIAVDVHAHLRERRRQTQRVAKTGAD
jgi:hypothetical protein